MSSSGSALPPSRPPVEHPDLQPETFAVSPKAWMSVRDADLCEHLLVRAASRRARLRVVEWGSGASTASFTAALDRTATPWSWLCLEYDRDFWYRDVLPRLAGRRVVTVEPDRDPNALATLRTAGGIAAAVYDRGRLAPFEAGHEADRLADLDHYVALPGLVRPHYHVLVVDGRKRRRCLLEAARLVRPDGLVLLHDAHRRPYQCAFAAFRSWRSFGDELWIGAQRDSDFRDLLPPRAFLPSRVGGTHPATAARTASR